MKIKRKKSNTRTRMSPTIKVIILVIGIMLIAVTLKYFSPQGRTIHLETVLPTPTDKPVLTSLTPTVPYKKPTESSPKNAVMENGYAIIPELGIKFKIENNLNGLIYSLYTFDQPGYQNYDTKTSFASFTTKTLLDSKGGKECTSQEDAIGDIGKSLDNPAGKGSGPSTENIKKIGDFYYHYLGPQAFCAYPNNEAMMLESQQIKALREAFQTMEVVN